MASPDRPGTAAPAVLPGGVDLPESPGYRLKKALLGPPLVSSELHNEKLSKPIALGVLAPDCISSSAYGTEQMLTQLIPVVGVAGFALVMPVTGVILALLVLLTLSYRDVVMTYTKAGGSYVVARENFGPRVAQIAAVALLIDYIVTVAVQTAAGTDAVASLLQLLGNVNIDHEKIWITVGVVCLLFYGNLRGIREAGKAFSLPTYLFIGATGLTVVVGMVRLLMGDLPQLSNADLHASGVIDVGHPGGGILMGASLFLLMRAFANGGSSLTGLEAISNGVSAFRSPQGANARRTLVIMSSILGVLVLGVSTLAWKTHAVPFTSGSPTVLAQEAHLVFGQSGFGNVMFAFVQIATALILYTGGNTSFNGFPFLASFVAEDSFLPRQLTLRGHRLAFSNGIIVLAVASLVLLIGTGGNLTKLVSLYAIGVFTGFVMAAAGLVKYNWVRRDPNRTLKIVVNAAAAVASAAVVVIFAVTKFTEGAWMVVVIFPFGVWALIRTNSRYRAETTALETAPASAASAANTRSVVYVLVDRLDLAVIKALHHARSLRPTELSAVHFMIDDQQAEQLRASWEAVHAADVPLEIIECPDRRLRRAVAELGARHRRRAHRRHPADPPPRLRPVLRPALPRPGRRPARPGRQPAAARRGDHRAVRRHPGDRGAQRGRGGGIGAASRQQGRRPARPAPPTRHGGHRRQHAGQAPRGRHHGDGRPDLPQPGHRQGPGARRQRHPGRRHAAPGVRDLRRDRRHHPGLLRPPRHSGHPARRPDPGRGHGRRHRRLPDHREPLVRAAAERRVGTSPSGRVARISGPPLPACQEMRQEIRYPGRIPASSMSPSAWARSCLERASRARAAASSSPMRLAGRSAMLRTDSPWALRPGARMPTSLASHSVVVPSSSNLSSTSHWLSIR